jgi:hypothetical protein
LWGGQSWRQPPFRRLFWSHFHPIVTGRLTSSCQQPQSSYLPTIAANCCVTVSIASDCADIDELAVALCCALDAACCVMRSISLSEVAIRLVLLGRGFDRVVFGKTHLSACHRGKAQKNDQDGVHEFSYELISEKKGLI